MFVFVFSCVMLYVCVVGLFGRPLCVFVCLGVWACVWCAVCVILCVWFAGCVCGCVGGWSVGVVFSLCVRLVVVGVCVCVRYAVFVCVHVLV